MADEKVDDKIIVEYRRSIMAYGETTQFAEFMEAFYEYNAYLHRKLLFDLRIPSIPDIIKREVDYIIQRHNGQVPENIYYPMVFHYSSLKSYVIHDGGDIVTVVIPSSVVKKGIQIELHCDHPLDENEKLETVQLMIVASQIIGVIHTITHKYIELRTAEMQDEHTIKRRSNK